MLSKTFASKGKRKHIAKVNIPHKALLNKHINIKISHGLRNHVGVPDTAKLTFNLEIESTDKTSSIANSKDRALVKKKLLMLGSKEINSDIYDT